MGYFPVSYNMMDDCIDGVDGYTLSETTHYWPNLCAWNKEAFHKKLVAHWDSIHRECEEKILKPLKLTCSLNSHTCITYCIVYAVSDIRDITRRSIFMSMRANLCTIICKIRKWPWYSISSCVGTNVCHIFRISCIAVLFVSSSIPITKSIRGWLLLDQLPQAGKACSFTSSWRCTVLKKAS